MGTVMMVSKQYANQLPRRLILGPRVGLRYTESPNTYNPH